MLRHIALLLVLTLATTETQAAPPLYRCVDDAGIRIYQDHDCGDNSEQLDKLAPLPVLGAQPENLAEAREPSSSRTRRKPNRAREVTLLSEEPTAFRCIATDGQVFYRHDGCPRSVPISRALGPRTPVHSEKVSRSTACREIERPASVGRRGQRQDQRTSTYDRNLGRRDPCG